MFPVELDVHTHTVSSGHYTKDTVTDMVKEARSRGLKLLGISEHGPAIPGSCKETYFRGLVSAPRTRMGLPVLFGAEVNILDGRGTLDLPDELTGRLDYCIAGMHLPCFAPGTSGENTAAYIHVMERPHIKILAHPDDVKYPVNYGRLVEAAVYHHVLLEINNSSLAPDGYRGDTIKNDRAILELCKQHRHPVLLSSDSHGHEHVGDLRYALELIHEAGFPEDLIINRSVRLFRAWI